MIAILDPENLQLIADGRKADPPQGPPPGSQGDRLLSGTIADSIAFFDADLDMSRVQQAAHAARVHEEILRMPMQYLSLVGDMGSTLSGGQRQRVLFARAPFIAGRRVLFLDEGTANLDEPTEEAIAEPIDQLPITRIVVAHRPALIRRAGAVYVVDGRKITRRTDEKQPAMPVKVAGG